MGASAGRIRVHENEPSILLGEPRIRDGREIELRLRAPAEALAALPFRAVLAERALDRPRRRNLVSVYYDTPDRALLARGLALRVRSDGSGFVQTLEAASEGAGAIADRAQWEVPIARAIPDLSAFAGTRAHALLDAVAPDRLAPVFETRIERTELRVGWPERSRPRGVVEVALDRGSIRADGREEPVAEIELELRKGDKSALLGLAERLRGELPLALEIRDKASRGWALAAGILPSPVKAGRPELDPRATVGEAFVRLGLSCLAHWLGNEPSLRASGDPEAAHQLRVGLRRLRSLLSLFRPVLPEVERARLAEETRWLLREVAPLRDFDVLVQELVAPLRAEELFGGEIAALQDALAERRPALLARARAALDSRRCTDLALDLLFWLELGRFRGAAEEPSRELLDRPVLPFARSVLERQWRKVRKRGRDFDRLDAEGRHALRIAIKKLRYGVEFFGSLWPGSGPRKYARLLAELQDHLGGLNDVAVAARQVRALVAELEPDLPVRSVVLGAGAVLGWHARAARKALARARDGWDALAASAPFWDD
ncbi:MAG: CHAD domain-containing protein [Geminicoccaceae bacterium]|nr:CHAD domain-containing protein [Geminicoccaceae bacterium]